jgi:hypothetical protein
LTLLDANQNGFGHYHQTTTKTISTSIIFNCRLWMEIEKRGNMTNPLLLVLVTHKDGQFFKIWLPSNYHNFLDGDRSFSITKKRVACHIFLTPFNGNLRWRPFLIIIFKFVYHHKVGD